MPKPPPKPSAMAGKSAVPEAVPEDKSLARQLRGDRFTYAGLDGMYETSEMRRIVRGDAMHGMVHVRQMFIQLVMIVLVAVGTGIIIAIALTLAWHMLAPEQDHWLSPAQYATLSDRFFSGVTGAVLLKMIEKSFPGFFANHARNNGSRG